MRSLLLLLLSGVPLVLVVVMMTTTTATNIVVASAQQQQEEVKNATIVWRYFSNGTGTITYGDGTVRNFTHNNVPPEYIYCNNSMYPVEFMKQMNLTLPSGC